MMGRLGKFSLTVLLATGGGTLASIEAEGQIIPDETLGAEQSIVNSIGGTAERIDGGALRGSNLFHSFQEFNIGEGRAAYFANPTLIRNIFSRVTGNNPSYLFGKLGVSGNANLFFINPNGIIFGKNASLDIRGSFFATTFPKVIFPDGSEFGAIDPQNAPAIEVEVKPLVGVYFEGTGHLIANDADLKVDPGQSITLFGKEIKSIGYLSAPGGTVRVLGTESVSLQEKAKIDVSSDTGGGTVLIGGDYRGAGNVPTSAKTYIGPNVSIKADALTSGDGGKIIVWSDKVTSFYGSISAKGGSLQGDGGFVEVSGKERLIFRGLVDTGAIDGKPGTLLLDPKNIVMENGNGDSATDGPNTLAGSSGVVGSVGSTDEAPTTIYESELEGLAGNNNVILQAIDNITLKDLADNELNLKPGKGSINFIADADRNGTGSFVMLDSLDTIKTSGRNLSISGASLTVANIDTSNSTQSLADSGSISLNATKGGISAGNLNAAATGNGGAIFFNSTGEIILNGTINTSSELDNRNVGFGNGGDVTLNAIGNIIFNSGSNIFSIGLLGGNIALNSSADISVVNGGILSISYGDLPDITGGNINVTSNSLSLNSGGQLGTVTQGRANAGNIIIDTKEFVSIVSSQGLLSILGSEVAPIAEGNSGDIKIKTQNLQLADGGQISASTFGKGNAGNLTIETNSLRLANGGQILSAIVGQGKGGSITVRANLVEAIGSNPLNPSLPSTLAISVRPGAIGNAGHLTIETNSLRVADGGQIQTATLGEGNGGSLFVRANSVEVIGFDQLDGSASQLSASVEPGAIGNAGNIWIEADSLRLVDGGSIVAITFGKGDGGSIAIRANSVEAIGSNLLNPSASSGLFANVNSKAEGNAGSLTIETESLRLIDGGQIAAITFGRGSGGSIAVRANSVEVIGFSPINGSSSILSTSVEPNAEGNAGNLEIKTNNLLLNSGGQITSSTFGKGNAGSVTVEANEVTVIGYNALDNDTRSGLYASVQAEAIGNGGNLTIKTNNLRLADRGVISARAAGKGDAGTINIEAASSVIVRNGSEINVDSIASGVGGNIELTAASLTLDKAKISAETDTTAGGNISLGVKDLLLLRNGSEISTTAGTARAGGNGGNINIDAGSIVAIPAEDSDITANAFEGNGGNIKINTRGIFGLEYRARPTILSDITASSSFGAPGTVAIDALDISIANDTLELPEQIMASFLSVGCGPRSKVELFDIGHGGSLSSPEEPVGNENLIVNWIEPISEEPSPRSKVSLPTSNASSLLFVPACAK